MQGSARKFPTQYLLIGLGLLILIAGYAIYLYIISNQNIPIFPILEEQEYIPNQGFSGAFSPGNLIQIKELTPDGEEHVLKTPVIFLWKTDCFPGLSPKVNTFVLPEGSGTAKASLSIGAKAISKIIPSLQLNDNAIIDYTLKFDNLRVHTFAKGDLSGHFSDKCIQAYDRQIRAGDQPEWFEIILEAVIAQALVFEMHWKTNTSAEARAKVIRQTKASLDHMLENANPAKQATSASIQLTSEDSKHTVFSSDGPVIIGYRSRPLQRQWDE